MCMCLARGGVGGEGGVSGREDWVWTLPILWEQGGRGVGRVSVFWLRWCGWWGLGREVGSGSGGVMWCYVCVRCESGFKCRWQVHVSVYCVWRIHAHLRCTQCSILLHLMDICFLTCICL